MSDTKVITGQVRLSYAHIHEPRAVEEGGEKKYSSSLLIPKDDTETVEKIKAAIEAALAAGKAKHGAGFKMKESPLKDGDIEKPDAPEYKGMYYVSASNKQKPILLDQQRNPIMDTREIYSGAYARASVNFFAFNVGVNKGVSCALNALQKVADGESLGSTYSESQAAEDFAADDI